MTENIFIFAAYSIITGSVTCAVILLIGKIVYKFTSARFMKWLTGFGLASFVIPSYMIYFMIEGTEHSFVIGDAVPLIVANSNFTEDIYIFLDRINFGGILTKVWIVGIFVYIVWSTISYVRAIFIIKKYSSPASGKAAEIYESIENDNRDKNTELLLNPRALQPYNIGVRKKYIVFPLIFEKLMSDDEIKLIFMHELVHAEKNDAFFKVLIEIMNGINWFNPFFYKIKKKYCFWTEACCDEELNQGFDEETRLVYINLMIKVAEINVKYKSCAASFLALKRTNIIKERMKLIMRNKKRGTKLATVAMSFMALSVFCGAGYAAKGADYAVYGVFGSDKNIVREGEFDVLTVDEAEELRETRNINDNSGYSEAEPKHIHTWIDTITTEHEKLDNGGCIMIYYNSKVCEDCGKVQIIDIFDVETFGVCPH